MNATVYASNTGVFVANCISRVETVQNQKYLVIRPPHHQGQPHDKG
jgi:hypothetical protein